MKVLFNIKKLQLSPITAIDTKGKPTYGTPLVCPGTVSLTMEAQGESEPFYADGTAYYSVGAATTYTGTLENALFSEEVLTEIYNYFTDKNNNLVETDEQPKEFGMQFAVDSDEGEVYFTYYRCTSTKPGNNFQTKEGNTTINPQSVSITAMPITLTDGTNVIKGYAKKGATNYATYMTSITVPEKAAA